MNGSEKYPLMVTPEGVLLSMNMKQFRLFFLA